MGTVMNFDSEGTIFQVCHIKQNALHHFFENIYVYGMYIYDFICVWLWDVLALIFLMPNLACGYTLLWSFIVNGPNLIWSWGNKTGFEEYFLWLSETRIIYDLTRLHCIHIKIYHSSKIFTSKFYHKMQIVVII